MTRTSKTNTYLRRGYMVTHHIQRTSNAHEHFFVVHDRGGLIVPKSRHLIRMFIPRKSADGRHRTVRSITSGMSGVHSIWYQVEIQYLKEEKKL